MHTNIYIPACWPRSRCWTLDADSERCGQREWRETHPLHLPWHPNLSDHSLLEMSPHYQYHYRFRLVCSKYVCIYTQMRFVSMAVCVCESLCVCACVRAHVLYVDVAFVPCKKNVRVRVHKHTRTHHMHTHTHTHRHTHMFNFSGGECVCISSCVFVCVCMRVYTYTRMYLF